MRRLATIALMLVVGCRTPAPETAVGAAREPGEGSVAAELEGPPEVIAHDGRDDGDAPAAPPLASAIVDELVAVLDAALAGGELPETSFRLPGTRGEQVVTVQGTFPEGSLTATASMLKVDVTLEGCGSHDGLTLGIFQSAAGSRLVGLGDQLTTAEGPTAEGLEEVVAAAEAVLQAIARGDGGSLVLDDALCESELGSVERCHRIFREIPEQGALDRYRLVLEACASRPRYLLSVVALFLRDESGAELQAVARLAARRGRLVLTDPIVVAPGVP